MQSIAHGLRAASRRQPRTSFLNVQPHLIASTSRTTVQWESRRGAWNPMDWFRKTVTPQIREKDDEKEVKEAREKAKESGEASVFEYDDLEAVAGAKAFAGRDAPGIPTLPPTSTSPKVLEKQRAKAAEARGATPVFSISHRKLNKLSQQIAGKPIDSAIMQMKFSEKRASAQVQSMLVRARGTAIQKGLKLDRLVVSEAWVNKGPGGKQAKRMEIKGRGKFGIRKKYKAKMVVLLREGMTLQEKMQRDREVKLRRIVSAGLVREDVPLRNPRSQWAW